MRDAGAAPRAYVLALIERDCAEVLARIRAATTRADWRRPWRDHPENWWAASSRAGARSTRLGPPRHAARARARLR
jgi:hypothetical protein